MEDWKKRLKQAREAKGLNKTQFAKLVGVSNPTVTDWEKCVTDGGIKEITGVKLTKVCIILGISAHWLLYGRENPDKQLEAGNPSIVSSTRPAPAMEDPQVENVGDALSLTCETAKELLLVAMYRLGNKEQRAIIDIAIEDVRQLMIADEARQLLGGGRSQR